MCCYNCRLLVVKHGLSSSEHRAVLSVLASLIVYWRLNHSSFQMVVYRRTVKLMSLLHSTFRRRRRHRSWMMRQLPRHQQHHQYLISRLQANTNRTNRLLLGFRHDVLTENLLVEHDIFVDCCSVHVFSAAEQKQLYDILRFESCCFSFLQFTVVERSTCYQS